MISNSLYHALSLSYESQVMLKVPGQSHLQTRGAHKIQVSGCTLLGYGTCVINTAFANISQREQGSMWRCDHFVDRAWVSVRPHGSSFPSSFFNLFHNMYWWPTVYPTLCWALGIERYYSLPGEDREKEKKCSYAGKGQIRHEAEKAGCWGIILEMKLSQFKSGQGMLPGWGDI